MTHKEFIETYEGEKLEGFDNCILGIVSSHGRPDVLLYDMQGMIDVLVAGGMTDREAWEYFDANIACAYYGEMTPSYAMLFEGDM